MCFPLSCGAEDGRENQVCRDRSQPCIQVVQLLPRPSTTLSLSSFTANARIRQRHLQGCLEGQRSPSWVMGIALSNQKTVDERLTQTTGGRALAMPPGSWQGLVMSTAWGTHRRELSNGRAEGARGAGAGHPRRPWPDPSVLCELKKRPPWTASFAKNSREQGSAAQEKAELWPWPLPSLAHSNVSEQPWSACLLQALIPSLRL